MKWRRNLEKEVFGSIKGLKDVSTVNEIERNWGRHTSSFSSLTHHSCLGQCQSVWIDGTKPFACPSLHVTTLHTFWFILFVFVYIINKIK